MGTQTGAQALEYLTQRAYSSRPFDAVVLDLWLEHEDGLEVLRSARKIAPDTSYVMMSGESNLRAAVEAIRLGAADFVVKPFAPGELLESLVRAMAQTKSSTSDSVEVPELRFRDRYAPDFIGEHARVRALFVIVERIARSNSTVLLHGETGTGKELIARALHAASARCNGPFVAINCAALPSGFAESVLFGHVRGAFPGASEAQDGQVIAAHRGTLFLDGVASLPMAVQSRLLRVLEQREVVPLGSAQPRRVDIRVIASTQHNLSQLVRQAAFREDLYHRLNTLPVELPALRERAEDIPILVASMRKRHSVQPGTLAPELTGAAWARLMTHPWPGNVRALDQFVERMCVLQGGAVLDEAALARLGLEDFSHAEFGDEAGAPDKSSSASPQRTEGHDEHWTNPARRGHLTLVTPDNVAAPQQPREGAMSSANVSESAGRRGVEAGGARSDATKAAPSESADVTRAPLMASTQIRLRLPDAGVSLYDVLEAIETDLIRQALDRTSGNRSAAAQLLGIRRTTLVEKLRRARDSQGDD